MARTSKSSKPATADVEETASTARRELMFNEIMEKATTLFAERGFARTTLQDVADAMGLTRPALYYYVRSKDELLGHLIKEFAVGPAEEIGAINADESLLPPDRLHRIAYTIASRQAHEPQRFQVLLRSEAELPAELATGYDQGRRRVLRELVKVISDGVESGHFRVVDVRTAALSIIGSCNWVAWWFNPAKDDIDKAATRIADFALASVAGSDPVATARTGPAQALAQVREDLDLLEKLIGDS